MILKPGYNVEPQRRRAILRQNANRADGDGKIWLGGRFVV